MTQIFCFPGQGSQVRGMGKDLFSAFPQLVAEADGILGYSLAELCVQDSGNRLRQTEYTQPALYCVNALTYFAKKVLPDAAAGHSLGEYNALLAAGVFDFSTGLRLVKKRGELMGRARNGAMAAVLGIPVEKVRQILAAQRLDGIDVANLNSSTQTVIAGLNPDIEKASDVFSRTGARFLALNVSAAFHSRYMSESAKEFRRFIEDFQFVAPRIPVIANATARPYESTPDKIRDLLASQIASPVNWRDSMAYLLALPDCQFKEIGPGQVLTKLLRENQKAATAPWPAAPAAVHPASPPPAPRPSPPRPNRNTPVFLFTGQGSQYFGMGQLVAKEEPEFRRALEEAASYANPRIGADLLAVLFGAEDPFAPFSRLLHSNAALFAIGYAFVRLMEQKGLKPGAVMGYGCGEFVALTAAGVLTLDEGMSLAIAQASAMERRCAPGAMLAVLGPAQLVEEEPHLFAGCGIAGVNFDRHFLLSGNTGRLTSVAARLKQKGIISIELPIHFALHTAAMDPAREEFERTARTCRWSTPRVPIYSPTRLEWADQPDSAYAWECGRRLVRFADAVEKLEAMGVGHFLDLGPSGTLANFVKHKLLNQERCAATLNRLSPNLEPLRQFYRVAGAR